MSTDTAENVIAADNSLTDLFIKAVAGRAEIITDEAVLTERGHDFWGFGGTAGLLGAPPAATSSPKSCESQPNTTSRWFPAAAHRTARRE